VLLTPGFLFFFEKMESNFSNEIIYSTHALERTRRSASRRRFKNHYWERDVNVIHDKHLSWENDRVSYLMKCLVPDDEERGDWAASVRKKAHPYLTFGSLRDNAVKKYGNPPVYFRASHIGGRGQLFDGSYWLDLSNNLLVEHYFNWRCAAQSRSNSPFAVVFNASTVRGGMVIHTLHAAAEARHPHDTIICGTGVNEEGKWESVIVQPYKSFAQWVAGKWAEKIGGCQLEESRPGVAALLRQNVPHRAVILLLVLREQLRDDDGRIRTTYASLATKVNMSVPTVTRALADLIEAELVESARGENCVHIRIA
jgi:hypothetical protein